MTERVLSATCPRDFVIHVSLQSAWSFCALARRSRKLLKQTRISRAVRRSRSAQTSSMTGHSKPTPYD
jgi:hypothetical protein